MSLKQSAVFGKRQIRLIKAKKGYSGASDGMFLLLCALLLFFYPSSLVEAATLTSSGGWMEEIGSSDLISGAGSDLTDIYTSPIAATTLEVSGCLDQTEEWQIMIKRVDQIWDSEHFDLAVKRTSAGTGSGEIIGGDSFQVVTTSDTFFLIGQGDRSGITVQYQLTGVSIQNLPDNYSTAVEFTINP